jgi:hypothetical protein
MHKAQKTSCLLTYRRYDSLDVDYPGDRDDRKSMSGKVLTLAGGAISWRCSKQ